MPKSEKNRKICNSYNGITRYFAQNIVVIAEFVIDNKDIRRFGDFILSVDKIYESSEINNSSHI